MKRIFLSLAFLVTVVLLHKHRHVVDVVILVLSMRLVFPVMEKAVGVVRTV